MVGRKSQTLQRASSLGDSVKKGAQTPRRAVLALPWPLTPLRLDAVPGRFSGAGGRLTKEIAYVCPSKGPVADGGEDDARYKKRALACTRQSPLAP